jgi:hypothetical protein
MTEAVAVALSVVAGAGAVVATAVVLLLERRRPSVSLEVEPPPSSHHVRVEINGALFEVNSSTRLTKGEVANLIETAVAAEERQAQGPLP